LRCWLQVTGIILEQHAAVQAVDAVLCGDAVCLYVHLSALLALLAAGD
jgi:hypothetical protein